MFFLCLQNHTAYWAKIGNKCAIVAWFHEKIGNKCEKKKLMKIVARLKYLSVGSISSGLLLSKNFQNLLKFMAFILLNTYLFSQNIKRIRYVGTYIIMLLGN